MYTNVQVSLFLTNEEKRRIKDAINIIGDVVDAYYGIDDYVSDCDTLLEAQEILTILLDEKGE